MRLFLTDQKKQKRRTIQVRGCFSAGRLCSIKKKLLLSHLLTFEATKCIALLFLNIYYTSFFFTLLPHWLLLTESQHDGAAPRPCDSR